MTDLPHSIPPRAADAEEPRVPIAVEQALMAAAMAALCLITFANVVARYLTNVSFAFTEEYSIALMVVLALLGSGAAAAADRHIRVTWFVDRLDGGWRVAAELFAQAATTMLFALLVWWGARFAWDEYRFEVTSPGLGVPTWIYTVWLPVLSATILLRVLGRTIRIWRRR